jgi:hypothetical protein
VARDAILKARNNGLPGFLLADEVGLGKTFSVLAAVHQMASKRSRPLKVLVLSPLSVVAHWRQSIRQMGIGNVSWCVVNYEQVKSLQHMPISAQRAKRTRTRNKRIAAEGNSRFSWDIVVCDESHRLKNPLAQRSRAVRQLVTTNRQGRRTKPAFTVWLSATAGENPLELSYLAPLLSARDGIPAASMKDFAEWCSAQSLGVKRAQFGSWVYEPSAEDSHRMHSLLFDPLAPGSTNAAPLLPALRRRPADVSGWPELVRQPTPVELTADSRRLYELAWEEFRKYMAMSTRGKDGPSALVAALRFRQKASLLRVPGSVQLIRDSLEDGLRPAVSIQFIETSDAIVESLPSGIRALQIDGRMTPRLRETARLEFQRGLADVIIFSVTEGISLHAGEVASAADMATRTLLLHDLRWSAKEMAQIEGRTHRDGQAAVAHYLYAEDTVEEAMVHAVVTKLTTMATMLGDDLTSLHALLAQV